MNGLYPMLIRLTDFSPTILSGWFNTFTNGIETGLLIWLVIWMRHYDRDGRE